MTPTGGGRAVELPHSTTARQDVHQLAVLPCGRVAPSQLLLLRQGGSAGLGQSLRSSRVGMTSGMCCFEGRGRHGADRRAFGEGHVDVDGLLVGGRWRHGLDLQLGILEDGLQRGGSRRETALAPGPLKDPVRGVESGQILRGRTRGPWAGQARICRRLPHDLVIEVFMLQLRRGAPADPRLRRGGEVAVMPQRMVREAGLKSGGPRFEGKVTGHDGKVGRGRRLGRGSRGAGRRKGLWRLAEGWIGD